MKNKMNYVLSGKNVFQPVTSEGFVEIMFQQHMPKIPTTHAKLVNLTCVVAHLYAYWSV